MASPQDSPLTLEKVVRLRQQLVKELQPMPTGIVCRDKKDTDDIIRGALLPKDEPIPALTMLVGIPIFYKGDQPERFVVIYGKTELRRYLRTPR